MTGINELTFYGSALTDIIVYSDNNDYASIDGIVYNNCLLYTSPSPRDM